MGCGGSKDEPPKEKKRKKPKDSHPFQPDVKADKYADGNYKQPLQRSRGAAVVEASRPQQRPRPEQQQPSPQAAPAAAPATGAAADGGGGGDALEGSAALHASGVAGRTGTVAIGAAPESTAESGMPGIPAVATIAQGAHPRAPAKGAGAAGPGGRASPVRPRRGSGGPSMPHVQAMAMSGSRATGGGESPVGSAAGSGAASCVASVATPCGSPKVSVPARFRQYHVDDKVAAVGSYSELRACGDAGGGAALCAKCVDRGRAAAERREGDLQREVEALQLLSRQRYGADFVCRLHHVEKTETAYIIVLDLVPGCSLRQQMIAFGGRVEEHYLREVTRGVVAALVFMHTLGVAHRALRPEHVALDQSNVSGEEQRRDADGVYHPRGRFIQLYSAQQWDLAKDLGTIGGYPGVKLCGFGHASGGQNSMNKRALHFSETHPYHPPELLFTGAAGMGLKEEAGDMWQLGVMLYHGLMGKAPFVDTNANALADKIIQIQWSFPRKSQLASKDAADLIKGLLCRMTQRLDLDKVLKSKFFGGDAKDQSGFNAQVLSRARGEINPDDIYTDDTEVLDIAPCPRSISGQGGGAVLGTPGIGSPGGARMGFSGRRPSTGGDSSMGASGFGTSGLPAVSRLSHVGSPGVSMTRSVSGQSASRTKKPEDEDNERRLESVECYADPAMRDAGKGGYTGPVGSPLQRNRQRSTSTAQKIGSREARGSATWRGQTCNPSMQPPDRPGAAVRPQKWELRQGDNVEVLRRATVEGHGTAQEWALVKNVKGQQGWLDASHLKFNTLIDADAAAAAAAARGGGT